MVDRHTVVPRVLCFVFYQNKILLIKAASYKPWAGVYNAVGGHIEKGESILAAANREIKEESGLNISDTQLKGIIHVSDFFGKDVMMFVTRSESLSGQVTPSLEGELLWVDPHCVDNLKMFEDMKPIINQLLQLKPGEIFVGTSTYDGQDKLLALDIKVS